jgi:type II restriction enzyme
MRSDQLRLNEEQHKPKNTLSKGDDKKVAEAMLRVIAYLEDRMQLADLGYSLEYTKQILLSELIDVIRSYKKRLEFADPTTPAACMRPDGGILLLRSKADPNYKRIVLAVEVKRQGTNDRRLAEGKAPQSRGNAIERLGKNLIGFRAALQYESVTPFICFGWGDDFKEGSSINDRVITMNEFYPLNRTFVFKREGYAPVSMFFREREWQLDELFEKMKEVAETSVRAYIH